MSMDQPVKIDQDATFTQRRKKWASGVWNAATTSYQLVLTSATALLVIGLLMVLSSSAVDALQSGGTAYSVFVKQTSFALGGVVLAFAASRIPVSAYKRFAPALFVLGLVLQALIFVPGMGVSAKGNTNWLVIAGVQIQPSEFLKLALCVFLGTIIARRLASATDWKHVLVPVGLASGLSILLVMAGDDLGTAMIFFFIVIGMLAVAGLPMKYFALVMAGAVVAVGLLAIFKKNRLMRIFATYDPNCDPQHQCYQVNRGLAGLGSGGLGGVGLGAGREKWSYLPEAHNDFIFVVLGEELGLIGTLSVIALFLLLGAAIIRIIKRNPDPMVKIASAGIGAWLIGQAAMNIGVVTKLFPVIGVPLPLVSAGGSSLIAALLAIGVLLAFARNEPGAKEAFSANGSVVRKTIGIISGSRRQSRPSVKPKE